MVLKVCVAAQHDARRPIRCRVAAAGCCPHLTSQITFVVWRQPDVVAAATPPPSPRVRPLNPLLRLQHHVRGMHHPWPCNRHEQRCSAQTFALMSLF